MVIGMFLSVAGSLKIHYACLYAGMPGFLIMCRLFICVVFQFAYLRVCASLGLGGAIVCVCTWEGDVMR